MINAQGANRRTQAALVPPEPDMTAVEGSIASAADSGLYFTTVTYLSSMQVQTLINAGYTVAYFKEPDVWSIDWSDPAVVAKPPVYSRIF